MSRKQPKRTAGNVAFSAIAGLFFALVIAGAGISAASANSADDVARSGAFGFNKATHEATAASQPVSDLATASIDANEQSALAAASSRDISTGLMVIDERERAEKERIAAENAAGIERMKAGKAKQGVAASASVADHPVEYSLPAVDWSVGREQFIAEWTSRIDAYLAGSPLSGYGYAFAEAAWDNGVDPRWSPAISNTESGKGRSCFLPCNAWGWGSTGWSDWDTAIRAHVSGLAAGYGYSITPSAAYAYCPPGGINWYNVTLQEMASI